MSSFTRISVQKANEIIHSGAATIVDVRDANSFAQGHIPEAQIVDDETIKGFLEKTNKEIPLVCYCYHGNSSQRAAQFFVSQGFKSVFSMDGGWEEWKTIYG